MEIWFLNLCTPYISMSECAKKTKQIQILNKNADLSDLHFQMSIIRTQKESDENHFQMSDLCIPWSFPAFRGWRLWPWTMERIRPSSGRTPRRPGAAMAVGNPCSIFSAVVDCQMGNPQYVHVYYVCMYVQIYQYYYHIISAIFYYYCYYY